MNLSIDSAHKGSLNPQWSLIQAPSLSGNMFPVRQQSHSKRFYNPPKTRRNLDNATQFRLDVTPVTMKIDADQYNKHKSNSLMAFCSTSRVKYMPLHGLSQDSFAQLKWNDPHSSFFPVISRPISRPVILHGKRYTILAVEGDRSHTTMSFTTKEEDKSSQKTERPSDQRRRFNEAECHKFNTRMYKDHTETSQCRIQRDYCLSGHRMFIKSSKESIDERLSRVRPVIHFQNIIKKEQPYGDKDVIKYEITKDIDHSDVVPDSEKKQTPLNGTKDSFISVDIVSARGQETEFVTSSRVCDVIKSACKDIENVEINQECYNRANLWLKDLVKDHVECVQQIIEEEDKDYFWEVLQPPGTTFKHKKTSNLFYDHFGHDTSTEVEKSIFLSTMFDGEDCLQEKSLWSKIFSLLGVTVVDDLLYQKITSFITFFKDENVSLDLIHDKILFWLKLFLKIFCVNEELVLNYDSYLKTFIKVTAFGNILNENSELSLERRIKEFIKDDLHEGQEDFMVDIVPVSNLLETIPWILSARSDIFHHLYSLDDMSILLSTLSNHFDH